MHITAPHTPLALTTGLLWKEFVAMSPIFKGRCKQQTAQCIIENKYGDVGAFLNRIALGRRSIADQTAVRASSWKSLHHPHLSSSLVRVNKPFS